MSTAAIVLAAGRGSRLGGTTPKPLVSLGNQALLCRTLSNYLALASSLDSIIVVLGYGAEEVQAQLPRDQRLKVVINPAWSQGLSSSLRVGVEALEPSVTTVLLGLGDMPWIPPPVLKQILTASTQGNRLVAPYFQGRRGHPVAFPQRFFAELRSLSGDRGGASLLETHRDELLAIEVEEPGVLRDLDFARDIPAPLPRVVLRGGGDLASGVAHRLYVSGFPVLITELPQPRLLRSSVCFGQAIYAQEVCIEGVIGRFYSRPPADWSSAIPVVVDADASWLQELRPDVLIDARMLKRPDDLHPALAPLVIALGPGLEAGRHCHAIIETERGHSLGKVILQGAAAPDTGIPGQLGGEGERRVLRAPCAGIFTGCCQLGQCVQEDQILGSVDGQPVRSRLNGLLRGLIHSGLTVQAREKLGDVDPRTEVDLTSISDKARAIAGGALEAIMRWHCGSLGRS